MYNIYNIYIYNIYIYIYIHIYIYIYIYIHSIVWGAIVLMFSCVMCLCINVNYNKIIIMKTFKVVKVS